MGLRLSAAVSRMYYVYMSSELIAKALRGDLADMNIIILARMSNESKRRKRAKDRENGTAPAFLTGLDIDTRERQVERCIADVEARGGKVVDVYEEPHTSAYKRRKMKDAEGNTIYRVVRPEYQKVLNDFKRGVSKSGHRIDGLMLADIDRLTRDNRDLEDAIDAVTYCQRPIIELTHTLDLSTRYGQQFARQLVAMKNGQSADTAQRVKDMHETLQLSGIPTGGTRPFGWQEDKRTLHPGESELLRQAVKDIFGGRSYASITAEWNKNAVTTVYGKKWRPTNFVKMLRNPRIAGYRMVTVPRDPSDPDSPKYHTVKLDHEGKPVIGQWERLISPEEWHALLAIIGEAPTRGSGTNTRKYLGTGTLRCGKCDMRMRGTKASASAHKPEGFFWYTCPPTSSGGCGGVRVPGPETDAALVEIVINKWELEAEDRATAQAPAEWTGAADLERVHQDMVAAKAARKAGRISAERYYADLSEYETEERALIKERSAFVRQVHAAADRPVNLRADWPGLTLTEQRAYLEKALTAVVIAPAGAHIGKAVPAKERITPVPAGRKA